MCIERIILPSLLVLEKAYHAIQPAASHWWHAVLWATGCNPIITYYAARSQSWFSVATLIAVFALRFVAIDAYKRRRGMNSVLQWLAVILVLTTNAATFFIAGTLQDHPLNGDVSLGELQIALTVCTLTVGLESRMTRITSVPKLDTGAIRDAWEALRDRPRDRLIYSPSESSVSSPSPPSSVSLLPPCRTSSSPSP